MIILTKSEVSLKNGSDKVYINIDISLSATKKISFDAYTELNGKIYYDNKSKKFEVDEFVMDKVLLKFHRFIQKTVEIVGKVVLNNYPVYKLNANDFKKTMTVLLLKEIQVKNEKMVITSLFNNQGTVYQ